MLSQKTATTRWKAYPVRRTFKCF